jgi:hypothetical protein
MPASDVIILANKVNAGGRYPLKGEPIYESGEFGVQVSAVNFDGATLTIGTVDDEGNFAANTDLVFTAGSSGKGCRFKKGHAAAVVISGGGVNMSGINVMLFPE